MDTTQQPLQPEQAGDQAPSLTTFIAWVFENNPANFYDTPEEMAQEWHLTVA